MPSSELERGNCEIMTRNIGADDLRIDLMDFAQRLSCFVRLWRSPLRKYLNGPASSCSPPLHTLSPALTSSYSNRCIFAWGRNGCWSNCFHPEPCFWINENGWFRCRIFGYWIGNRCNWFGQFPNGVLSPISPMVTPHSQSSLSQIRHRFDIIEFTTNIHTYALKFPYVAWLTGHAS